MVSVLFQNKEACLNKGLLKEWTQAIQHSACLDHISPGYHRDTELPTHLDSYLREMSIFHWHLKGAMNDLCLEKLRALFRYLIVE